MLTQWIPRNNISVFAPSLAMLTFINLTDKEAVQCPMTKGSVRTYGGSGWRGDAWGKVLSHLFFSPPLSSWWLERQVQGRERKKERANTGGGVSDFFRCSTLRHGGGNSGCSHPSQGQMLFFMQEQTPAELLRQATSHAPHSLVIIRSAAWPQHSHVNVHTGLHFAWRSD